MSKLPKEHKFIDLSDYGRPIARLIANSLRNTTFTPVHITLSFVIAGLIGVYCILVNQFLWAAFFLVLKSILDAADGELARVKNTPSYTGRFLDSVSDILLNAILFTAIWHITATPLWVAILAFLGLQLQGTLYNYYYAILKNKFEGDTTSRIFEVTTPVALEGESQKMVNILFRLYKALYGTFDKTIYALDTRAATGKIFPNWLMSCISTFGLGFQLLLIGVLLVLGLKEIILPFFLAYTIMVFVFIMIRKVFFRIG